MSSQVYKRKLSGSTEGSGIVVSATGSPGTLIHTAVSGFTIGSYDEIWLWAYNDSTSYEVLTIEYASTSYKVTVPPQCGLVPILPGLVLQNSETVNAFSINDSVITIFGFTHSIAD